jgi:glyoxylase-like metal-dependent hydrolase (beta-lactamase superfamily II)
MTSDPFSLSVVSPSLRERWGLVAACSAVMAMSSDVWYTASVFFVALIQLQDGDELDLGRALVLRVLHTPGHTPGSISLYWEREGILFTGDSLQGRGSRPGWMPL